MSNNARIFVHGLPEHESKQIEVPANATIRMLLQEILKVESLELLAFIEDMEEALSLETTIEALNKGREIHIHVHKQSKIEVLVEHNGHTIEQSYAPSTRIVNILKWCFHKFDIAEQDQRRIVLALEPHGPALDVHTHLGSLVPHAKKSIRLYLTHGKHIVNFTVDDEPQVTTEWELTARQILTNAHIDTANHYLVQLVGHHHQESYNDKMDEPIHMHENMKFMSVETGETPVS